MALRPLALPHCPDSCLSGPLHCNSTQSRRNIGTAGRAASAQHSGSVFRVAEQPNYAHESMSSIGTPRLQEHAGHSGFQDVPPQMRASRVVSKAARASATAAEKEGRSSSAWSEAAAAVARLPLRSSLGLPAGIKGHNSWGLPQRIAFPCDCIGTAPVVLPAANLQGLHGHARPS